MPNKYPAIEDSDYYEKLKFMRLAVLRNITK